MKSVNRNSGPHQFNGETADANPLQSGRAGEIAVVGMIDAVIDFDDRVCIAVFCHVNQVLKRLGLVEILSHSRPAPVPARSGVNAANRHDFHPFDVVIVNDPHNLFVLHLRWR